MYRLKKLMQYVYLKHIKNLEIVGYTLIRADHPSNTKRGGVCIYSKHSLAFRLLDICYLESVDLILLPHIFSVQVKSGACSIMASGAEFRKK